MHSIVRDSVFILPGFNVEIMLYMQYNLLLKPKSKKQCCFQNLCAESSFLFNRHSTQSLVSLL